MTTKRLIEMIDGVLAWGADHNEEFRGCLVDALGITEEEYAEIFEGENLNEYLGIEEEKVDLPSWIVLDKYDIQDNAFNVYDDEELEQQLSDYLSDSYGYCHKGFKYECKWDKQFPDQINYIKIYDIDWDTEE